MSVRNLKLPGDLEDLGPMLTESFQYPENPEWSVQEDESEALADNIRNIGRMWWVVRIGQIFIPMMRDLLPGKVWVEDGKIVGAVLYQRRGASQHWMVSTVATMPEYRRRGIARKLVVAGLEYIRAKKGEVAVLDVIDANYPAYKLYESLGFEHFSDNLDLEFTPDGVYPAPGLEGALSLPGYTVEEMDVFDWRSRFEVMQRISPETIQQYEPVSEDRFRQPGYMRLLIPLFERAQKTQSVYHLIRRSSDGEKVGYLNYDIRTGGKGRHAIFLRLDPAHGALAEPLLAYALHRLTAVNPDLMIEMGQATWQPQVVEAAYALGFTKRLQYHRMGVVLD